MDDSIWHPDILFRTNVQDRVKPLWSAVTVTGISATDWHTARLLDVKSSAFQHALTHAQDAKNKKCRLHHKTPYICVCVCVCVCVCIYIYIYMETGVAEWLRCCAPNPKVAGSIPDGVIGIFLSHNPSDRTMALGSTQPLTEMSTRSISWG